MQLSELGQWIDGQKSAIESNLRQLVEINTHTENRAGVDAGMAALSVIAQNEATCRCS